MVKHSFGTRKKRRKAFSGPRTSQYLLRFGRAQSSAFLKNFILCCMFCTDLACHQELGNTKCHSCCNKPFLHTILFARYQDAPNHDRHHFETLSKHLHREGYPLQCLILASSSSNVAERDSEILPEWAFRGGIFLVRRIFCTASRPCFALHQSKK